MDDVVGFKKKFDKNMQTYLSKQQDIPFFNLLEDAILKGGKRLRPYLLMQVAQAYGKQPRHLALSIEMQHVHSLILDDIMDEDAMRRHRPTANKLLLEYYKEDTREGKYLFASAKARRASSQAMMLSNILLLLSRRVLDGCEHEKQALHLIDRRNIELYRGQMKDIDFEGSSIALKLYLQMIQLKTATLFGLAAQLGALSEPENVQQMWYSIGESLAMAFQIKDDLLDISTSKGHEVGSDIINHKQNILMVLLLEHIPLRKVEKMIQASAIKEVIKLMHRYDVPKNANQLAETYMFRARKLLASVPEAHGIESFIGYMVSRNE